MNDSEKNRAARRPALRRAVPFLLAVGLAVGLHLALLGGLGDDRARELPPALQATSAPQPRTVETRPAAVAAAPAQLAPTDPPHREPATPEGRPSEPQAAAAARSSEKRRPVVKQPQQAPATAAASPAAEAPALVPAAVEVEEAAAGGSAPEKLPIEKVPVYATRVPPSTTLRYVMSRGPIAGEGELRWQRNGSTYELRLEGRVPLLGTLLTQVSRGGFDSAGLAPERHTDKRRRRGEQAANFQRDAGLITFSGSSAQYPLVPGAQDRVSWMVQLAAIAQAWRGSLASGEHIVLLVASARGDADVWSFRVQGTETVSLPVGPVPTLKLLREPRRPYDTKVEVWLDPARHHLPVRARLTDTNGDPFELQLSEELRAP
jgi:hypothetical protein